MKVLQKQMGLASTRIYRITITGFLCACFLTVCQVQLSDAQVGVRVYYTKFSPAQWYTQLDIPQSNLSGYHAGVDFWFRLRDQRIEFTPELSFERLKGRLETDIQIDNTSFGIPVHIYLFNLPSDCDCPTFSKEGGSFQKGFFLMLTPSYSLFQMKRFDVQGELDLEYDKWVFTMAAGLGLDIGISNHLTMTPLFAGRYIPNLSWDNYYVDPAEEESLKTVNMLELWLGVRFGFYWN